MAHGTDVFFTITFMLFTGHSHFLLTETSPVLLFSLCLLLRSWSWWRMCGEERFRIYSIKSVSFRQRTGGWRQVSRSRTRPSKRKTPWSRKVSGKIVHGKPAFFSFLFFNSCISPTVVQYSHLMFLIFWLCSKLVPPTIVCIYHEMRHQKCQSVSVVAGHVGIWGCGNHVWSPLGVQLLYLLAHVHRSTFWNTSLE